jgi:hypothetical protein
MADPFGVSFSPTGQNGPNGQPQAPGSRPSPIQQAIQTLSLRIPRVAGASAFTAQPLLTSAGGSGLGDPNSAAVLEQLRRMLFGSPAGMSQGPTAPSPMGGQSGQDPFAALAQALGISQGSQMPQQPTSGSGAPLDNQSGTGSPLPADPGGVPLPNFVAGKNEKPITLQDQPLANTTAPEPRGPNTRYL